MNNFKIHELAQQLSDTKSSYELARMLVVATELLDNSDRYQDTDSSCRESPFCNEVRTWLKDNLETIIPDIDIAQFGG